MYENVVFAILALGFILLAARQRDKMIPLLSLVYRACIILCIGMAVINSYSVQQTATTFYYNASGIFSANSLYTYSNQLTGQANNQAIIIVFVIMMIVGIIVEIVEESLNTTEKLGEKLGKGK